MDTERLYRLAIKEAKRTLTDGREDIPKAGAVIVAGGLSPRTPG